MSPDQKAQLVEHLISIGYCVSMCKIIVYVNFYYIDYIIDFHKIVQGGDGANDCGALKAGEHRSIIINIIVNNKFFN